MRSSIAASILGLAMALPCARAAALGVQLVGSPEVAGFRSLVAAQLPGADDRRVDAFLLDNQPTLERMLERGFTPAPEGPAAAAEFARCFEPAQRQAQRELQAEADGLLDRISGFLHPRGGGLPSDWGEYQTLMALASAVDAHRRHYLTPGQNGQLGSALAELRSAGSKLPTRGRIDALGRSIVRDLGRFGLVALGGEAQIGRELYKRMEGLEPADSPLLAAAGEGGGDFSHSVQGDLALGAGAGPREDLSRVSRLYARTTGLQRGEPRAGAKLAAAAAISGQPPDEIEGLYREALAFLPLQYDEAATLAMGAAVSGKGMAQMQALYEEFRETVPEYPALGALTAAAAISGKSVKDVRVLYDRARKIPSAHAAEAATLAAGAAISGKSLEWVEYLFSEALKLRPGMPQSAATLAAAAAVADKDIAGIQGLYAQANGFLPLQPKAAAELVAGLIWP